MLHSIVIGPHEGVGHCGSAAVRVKKGKEFGGALLTFFRGWNFDVTLRDRESRGWVECSVSFWLIFTSSLPVHGNISCSRMSVVADSSLALGIFKSCPGGNFILDRFPR